MQVTLCSWSKKVPSDHFVFGVVPCTGFPLLSEHYHVDSLENIRLLTLKRFAQVSLMLIPVLFFHLHFTGLTRYTKFCEEFLAPQAA